MNTFEPIQHAALPTAILIASFLGSWHCAGMCGPIASLLSQRRSLIAYNFGRLISYSFIGVLSGWLGLLFLDHINHTVRILGSLFMAFFLIYMGLSQLRLSQLTRQGFISNTFLKPFGKIPAFGLSRFFPTIQPNSSALLIGILTIFLPCGWLYTFAAAAMSTQNPLSGLFIMQLFWLGGLPAVNTLSIFIHKRLKHSPTHMKKISGFILICSGVYSLLSFWL